MEIAIPFPHSISMNLSQLTPDALAALEARLAADLEMVRRVRALVAEYAQRLPLAPATQPAPTPALPAEEMPPPKSWEERLDEMFAQFGTGEFTITDLKRVCQNRGIQIQEAAVKQLLQRRVRTGQVELVQKRLGRGGNLYRNSPGQAEAAPAVEPVSPAR